MRDNLVIVIVLIIIITTVIIDMQTKKLMDNQYEMIQEVSQKLAHTQSNLLTKLDIIDNQVAIITQQDELINTNERLIKELEDQVTRIQKERNEIMAKLVEVNKR